MLYFQQSQYCLRCIPLKILVLDSNMSQRKTHIGSTAFHNKTGNLLFTKIGVWPPVRVCYIVSVKIGPQ